MRYLLLSFVFFVGFVNAEVPSHLALEVVMSEYTTVSGAGDGPIADAMVAETATNNIRQLIDQTLRPEGNTIFLWDSDFTVRVVDYIAARQTAFEVGWRS